MTLALRFLPAALAANESERLSALYALNILDSEPERAFDQITELASELCHCPIALVTLVDKNRQWFKSRYGLDTIETERDISFCAHAILQTDVFEVPDTLKDDRFADHPAVTGEPHVRFYAGAPLVSTEGYAFGTLCIVDTKPRHLSLRHRQILQKLANQVNALLSARADRFQAIAHEHTLSRLLDAMPNAVVACNAEGKLTQFNELAQAWHGTDVKLISADKWPEYFDLFHAHEHRHLMPHEVPLLRTWQGHEVKNLEIKICAKGQPPRLVNCNGRQLLTPSGELLGAIVVMNDITNERQQAELVQEEKRHLNMVLDGTRAGTWDWNIKTGEVLYNERWAEIIGYQLAQLQPISIQTWQKFCHPDDYIKSKQLMHEHFAGQAPAYDYIARMLHSSGHWVWVHARGRVYEWDEHNKPLKIAGTLIDVSQQHQAKEQLLLSAQRFKGVFDSAALGIGIVSLDGYWVEVNQALCKMLGYTEQELLSLNFQQLTLSEDLKTDLTLLKQLLSGDIPLYQLKKRFITKSGALIWVLTAVSVVRDIHGQPLHLVKQVEDINQQTISTEALADNARFQKALFNNMAEAVIVVNEALCIEQSSKSAVLLLPALTGKGQTSLHDVLPELVQPLQQLTGHIPKAAESRFELDVDIPWRGHMSLEFSLSKIFRNGSALWIVLIRDLSEAKRIDRMKDEFVSTVSHELRTPLTSIRGALGLITAGALGTVPEPIQNMLTIADDNSLRLNLLINDLLDLEKLQAGKFELNFKDVDITALIDHLIETMSPVADSYQVTIRRTDNSAVTLNTDPHRLTQALSNLLSNACKYSPPNDEVLINHKVINDNLMIEVIDHGAGIPNEFRERIFTKFCQADSSDTRGKAGTGLGLAICKQLIEHMGGQIGYVSEPGHGACFWITLPISK
jgi:PAS domain S-box-containing protein